MLACLSSICVSIFISKPGYSEIIEQMYDAMNRGDTNLAS